MQPMLTLGIRHDSCTQTLMRQIEHRWAYAQAGTARGKATSHAVISRAMVAAALFGAALFCGGSGVHAAARATQPWPIERLLPKRADFGSFVATREARNIADWAVDARDHEGMPFMIVDKAAAQLLVFNGRGQVVSTSPVLIGAAVGDVFEPGVADMDMYDTKPWQRITPAGRYRADLYRTQSSDWSVWVDYDTGIALHKVLTTNRAQNRLARLASEDAAHRRITFGCINVPAAFFDRVVYPLMRRSDAIVYVLPETQSAQALFASYRVPERYSPREHLAARSGWRNTTIDSPNMAAVYGFGIDTSDGPKPAGERNVALKMVLQQIRRLGNRHVREPGSRGQRTA
jgi:hypothetical protein